MFRYACLLLCIFSAQTCHALTLDYEACGFVNRSDGKSFYPAAFYRSEDKCYVITNEEVNGQEHDFYYRTKDQEYTGSAIMLLSGNRRNPYISSTEQLLVFTVPLSAIDQELAEIVYKCAVQQDDFVDSIVGTQVVIHSQSKNLNKIGPKHRGTIAALNHFSHNRHFSREAYNMVQPPSPGATCLSWVCKVQTDPDSTDIEVVGMLIDHVIYKAGEGFFGKEVVHATMTGDLSMVDLGGLFQFGKKNYPNCTAIFISDIDSSGLEDDKWRPIGSKKGDEYDGRLERDSDMFLRIRSDEFGFPAFIVESDKKQYLVLQTSDATSIQSQSKLTTQMQGHREQGLLSERFDLSDAGKIAMGSGLIAYRLKSDGESDKKRFKAIKLDGRIATGLDKLSLQGISIPSSVFAEDGEEGLEECMVYSAGVENDPLHADIGGMNFDSGIYPAAVYASDNSGGLFAGILCKDKEKVRIYSAEEIRTALDSKSTGDSTSESGTK